MIKFAKHRNSTLRNQRESPFLRLPLEIRHYIYVYTLSTDRIWCEGYLGTKEGSCDPMPVSRTPSSTTGLSPRTFVPRPRPFDPRPLTLVGDLIRITETCRQIRAESALIFFATNDFGFQWNSLYEHCWYTLRRLSAQQRQSIRTWWCGTCSLEDPRIPFERLPELRSIVILSFSKIEEANERGEHEARVRGQIRMDAGRELKVTFDYETRV